MAEFTPASLQLLREALPPFGSEAAAAPPPALRAFCNYYGIDFSARFPRASYRCGGIESAEFTVASHCWVQPEATHNLLLLHGYFDHVGLFGKLIEHGLARNCNVLAFDLPGHGLSTGSPAAIDDFGSYSRAIADVLAGVELPTLTNLVIAQSTGGAALIEFARNYPWPFAGTVLLAPLLRPARWWQVNSSYMLLHKFIASVPRQFAENSSDADFLDFVQRDPLQSRRIPVNWVGALRRWLAGLPLVDLGVGPALVIQGTSDATVDWRYNLPQLGKLFPGLHIELVPDAGHHLANESAAIRERYLAAVDRYLGVGKSAVG